MTRPRWYWRVTGDKQVITQDQEDGFALQILRISFRLWSRKFAEQEGEGHCSVSKLPIYQI